VTTIGDVDTLYELAAITTVRRARIVHAIFREYSIGVNRLIKILGDSVEEELWKNVLAPLKRYRYALSTAPLPFNSNVLSIAPALRVARERLPSFESAHPVAARQLAIILDSGEHLQTCPDNPIRDFILNEFPRGVINSAIVLKDTRFITPVQELFRSHPATSRLTVFSGNQLKAGRCYDQIVLVGAARWFPDYVITAPRGGGIWIVRYGWIRDTTPTRRVFDQHWPKDAASFTSDPADGDNPDEVLDAQEILPSIDWGAIERRGLTQVEHSLEDVPAKIALLEGDFGVFLEDDESATVLTVDLEADDPTERVRRTHVQRLMSGMIVLLRTTGGGDYILPVADKILGNAATSLRSCQREWKAGLRRAVNQSSLFEISIRLLERGSTCANEVNVRNWMSLRTIKTYDPKDFAAIMELIGLKHRTEEYWNAMVTISQAHQKAGQQIRRALLRRLRELDLTILEREGRLDISLPDIDAGALTAFRVIDVASANQLIGTSKLSHPFPLGNPDGAYNPR
jgi:hypothetical protein